ncbi:hypothetical protein COX09_00210 [Candidatus Beckwithbacteria bacterium CG23_combo_of_CG06-09_8_20_14_all_47_9]|uniref:Glycosyltransferase RgtA/B/C/D-like domain-containing protein n=1 Tax=Candidatus Beckwithbacteria bacterium CG23_combo_of_CG06-09_8_20_14_all_47_9 TaxID=1974498 RepID=A0A2H0B4U6_9BACT|nr:MAG: hypothetical protein COX09_00210 [Candidatus Beckwithbacteria bacterium CG23_combo_of_CG06-09_8_20_14_all_47_9]
MAEKIKIALVLSLAAILGFFRISRVPPALNWDEAAIGWNAKTIWEMHLDEFGTRWPISFRSFGDYKAPLYIYLTAPVVGIFGSNEISVRLVSVMAGITSVGLMYFIGGFAAAVLLAISPWHILLARPALEANLALMWILAGIYLFKLAGEKRPILLIGSAISFVLSMYSYQSPKIFVPVFVLGLLIIYRSALKPVWRWLIIAGVIAGAAIYPLIKDGLGAGGRRFAMTSVFYQPANNLPLTLAKNYLAHWSPRWLFLSGGETGRSQMRQTGMLLFVTAPFFIIGLMALWKKRKKAWSRVLFWWLLTAPVPAMIGFEVPHPIRAYQLLPVLTIITAVGIKEFSTRSRLILYTLLVVNSLYFFYQYFIIYPVESARDWQYGYKQAAVVAREWEDRVDKVIISSYYGQPYVFTYWYQDRRPQSIFWGGAIKYLFRPVKLDGDKLLPNTLIIGSPEDIPSGSEGIIKEIYFPDGSVAFRVIKT